jgi:hypothetical protein
MDDQVSIPGRTEKEYLLFASTSRPALGLTQSPIQWVQGALSPVAKRSGHEADHSPPSSVKVKNGWSSLIKEGMYSPLVNYKKFLQI